MRIKKTLLITLIVGLLCGLLAVPAFAANLNAVPSNQNLIVNGQTVKNIPVYNIDGCNYFKLRDILYYTKHYEMDYIPEANTIAIYYVTQRTGVIDGVSKEKATQTTYGVSSSQKVYVNGWDLTSKFHPVNINGNNYFQLRELGSRIDFGVDYDAKTNTITVDDDHIYWTIGIVPDNKKQDGWHLTYETKSLEERKADVRKQLTASNTTNGTNNSNLNNGTNNINNGANNNTGANNGANNNPQQKPVDATGVSLSEYRVTLEKGQSYQIKASVQPENATNKALTYKSNDTSIATVSSSGLVQAKGAGNAQITISSANGMQATFYVSVNGFRYDYAKEVYRLVNEERAKRGIASIPYFEEAQEVADIRAKEAIQEQNGIPHAGSPAQFGAENLYFGAGSPESAMYGWVYDDAESNWGHRDNILSKSAKSIVVGCYCYNGRYYWSQDFYFGWAHDDNNIVNSPATQAAVRVFHKDVIINQGDKFSVTDIAELNYWRVTSSNSSVVNVSGSTGYAQKAGKATISLYNGTGSTITTVDVTVLPSNEKPVEPEKDNPTIGNSGSSTGNGNINSGGSNSGTSDSGNNSNSHLDMKSGNNISFIKVQTTDWGWIDANGYARFKFKDEKDYPVMIEKVLEWDKTNHRLCGAIGTYDGKIAIVPWSQEGYIYSGTFYGDWATEVQGAYENNNWNKRYQMSIYELDRPDGLYDIYILQWDYI